MLKRPLLTVLAAINMPLAPPRDLLRLFSPFQPFRTALAASYVTLLAPATQQPVCAFRRDTAHFSTVQAVAEFGLRAVSMKDTA
jgi:hypothetical protein